MEIFAQLRRQHFLIDLGFNIVLVSNSRPDLISKQSTEFSEANGIMACANGEGALSIVITSKTKYISTTSVYQ